MTPAEVIQLIEDVLDGEGLGYEIDFLEGSGTVEHSYAMKVYVWDKEEKDE